MTARQAIFYGLIISLVSGTTEGLIVMHGFRNDLIERGLAEYCATDGLFAFKGECGE